MLLMLIYGTKKEPNGAKLCFNQGAYVLTGSPHIFSVGSDFGGGGGFPSFRFHRDPCQPLTLFLSGLKSGPFSAVWSCHPTAAPPCPSSTLHLTCSYTGIKMNKYHSRDCQDVCIACILQEHTHTNSSGYMDERTRREKVENQIPYRK